MNVKHTITVIQQGSYRSPANKADSHFFYCKPSTRTAPLSSIERFVFIFTARVRLVKMLELLLAVFLRRITDLDLHEMLVPSITFVQRFGHGTDR